MDERYYHKYQKRILFFFAVRVSFASVTNCCHSPAEKHTDAVGITSAPGCVQWDREERETQTESETKLDFSQGRRWQLS